jgi:hypothetical protein
VCMFVRQVIIIIFLFDDLGMSVKYSFRYGSINTHVHLLTQKLPTFVGTASDYNIMTGTSFVVGARGSVVVKALCCKPEGLGFDSR